MTNQHAHLYRDISEQGFQLFRRDLDHLRNKLRYAAVDISRIKIARMDRNQLIDTLLAIRFGADAYIEYKAQCIEWDRCKQLVRPERKNRRKKK